MANELTPIQKISSLMNGDAVKNKFSEMLGEKAPQFISSVMSAVSANPMLMNATPQSVYGAAMMACVVGLPINNLGAAYIVPFNTKRKDATGKDIWVNEAQYQVGARGYRMLAQNTQLYTSIHSGAVYEGEIKSYDIETGRFEFYPLSAEDMLARRTKKVIGYFASFTTKSGEKEQLFMSIDELKSHGKRYSKTYEKSNSTWQTNFEEMAKKTVLKKLLKDKGIISYELQRAIQYDQAVVRKDANDLSDIADNEVVYVDNEKPNLSDLAEMAEEVSITAE